MKFAEKNQWLMEKKLSLGITKNFIVPAWVGFDIGCGMIAIQLKSKNILQKTEKNKDKIYSEIVKKIPMG